MRSRLPNCPSLVHCAPRDIPASLRLRANACDLYDGFFLIKHRYEHEDARGASTDMHRHRELSCLLHAPNNLCDVPFGVDGFLVAPPLITVAGY